MPQFTPTDRDLVREWLEGQSRVHNAGICGEGISVIEKSQVSGEGFEKCYTNLMEEQGWYVASIKVDSDGNMVTLMPVPKNAASGGSEQ